MKILSRIRNACLNEGIPINNTRDVLMMIRQLEIGFGCPNQCSSCFSAAPQKIIQMKYRCFKKIMCEMGRELKRKQAKREGRNVREVQIKKQKANEIKPKTLFVI